MMIVYADCNATTPIDYDVYKAMLPYIDDQFGNPSSIHRYGQITRSAIDNARRQVAELIGCSAGEVIFTSGGTESDNLAIKGFCFANKDKGNHIITSSIEHSAVLDTCKFLEAHGFDVTYLPVDQDGIVDLDALQKSIKNSTILISIMTANNETGAIQPVNQIGEIAREKGICFHADAVQSAGKIPINVNEIKADLLAISSHKIYGPKGVGALYIRNGIKIEKQLHGGHQEYGIRGGTENTPAIVGFGKACEIAGKDMEINARNIKNVVDFFISRLSNKVSDFKIHGNPEKRLFNTVNISFAGIEGESLLLSLDLKGIMVSTGSACMSGSTDSSYVLQAMGIDPALAKASIRFSFGKYSYEHDMGYIANRLAESVEQLRNLSPSYRNENK